jgi:hypothetical protein
MTQRVLNVLWPAFVMAGVLEAIVFAQVDPSELHGFGTTAAAWSPQAIYTLAFFVFWATISIASAVTQWMAPPRDDTSTPH